MCVPQIFYSPITLHYNQFHISHLTHLMMRMFLNNDQIKVIVPAISKMTLHKGSSFFNSSVAYVTFKEDLVKLGKQVDQITNFSVQLSVYGQFNPQVIVQHFSDYVSDALSYLNNLVHLKISLAGIDLANCPKLILSLCKLTQKNYESNRRKLKTLELLTSNLSNCQFADFESVIQLGIKLGLEQVQKDSGLKVQNVQSFQNLTLQFNNWSFAVHAQKLVRGKKLKRSQPTMGQLKNILTEFVDYQKYTFKKFRLEISTWYYSLEECMLFLNQNNYNQLKNKKMKDDQIKELIAKPYNNSLNEFHSLMKTFVGTCYDIMPDVKVFQMDFRNWHSTFKLKQNKSNLIQITNINASTMSIMSKNITNRYAQLKKQQEGLQKTFQRKFQF